MLYHRNSLNYWAQIIGRYGLLQGELLRGISPADIMSKYVEFNESGGRPLVKVYSRRQARKLFSMFREVNLQVEPLMRSELYLSGRFVPEALFSLLRRAIGWNVIISARK